MGFQGPGSSYKFLWRRQGTEWTTSISEACIRRPSRVGPQWLEAMTVEPKETPVQPSDSSANWQWRWKNSKLPAFQNSKLPYSQKGGRGSAWEEMALNWPNIYLPETVLNQKRLFTWLKLQKPLFGKFWVYWLPPALCPPSSPFPAEKARELWGLTVPGPRT